MESRSYRYLWRLLPLVAGLVALLLSAAVAAAQDMSVDITVDAPTSGQSLGDDQQITVGGWAVDTDVTANTGIDQVHIYADGPAGEQALLSTSARPSGPKPPSRYRRFVGRQHIKLAALPSAGKTRRPDWRD